MRHIIFDLSETLIYGLCGVEEVLAPEVGVPEEVIFSILLGGGLYELFEGRMPEEAFLERLIRNEGWGVEVAWLKGVIRANFHREVDGALALLHRLADRYDVVLLSDHVREWVTYIKSIHSFFDVFERTFFSYELGTTKKDPGTFLKVLSAMAYAPDDCLFIDDTLENVQRAESVGMAGIQFVDAGQVESELKRQRVF